MHDRADVDLWFARVDDLDTRADGTLAGLLDDEERRRNARFKVERPRRLHLAAHALARVMLGHRLGTRPEALRFAVGSKGKPFLVEPATTLEFNLAHSGGLVVGAMSERWAVGVDVEPVDRRELSLELARAQFAPAEVAILEALDPEALREGLVAIWTGKEAVIKAHGDGLSLPLERFVVPLQAGPVEVGGILPTGSGRWQLHRLAPDPRHRVALVVAAPPAVPLEVRPLDATARLRQLELGTR